MLHVCWMPPTTQPHPPASCHLSPCAGTSKDERPRQATGMGGARAQAGELHLVPRGLGPRRLSSAMRPMLAGRLRQAGKACRFGCFQPFEG